MIVAKKYALGVDNAPRPSLGEATDLSSSDEFRFLQVEEIRLRISDMRRPCWQRPATLAPLATMLAAALGLVWGIATGFFDVSRRELALAKRELVADANDLRNARDRQTAAFLAEKRREDLVIAQLRLEAAVLRQERDKLDAPTITEAVFGKAAAGGPIGLVLDDLTIKGQRFGSGGIVVVSFAASCRRQGESEHTNTAPIEAVVKSWSDSMVVVSLKPASRVFMTTVSELPDGCRAYAYDILVHVRRADGRESNSRTTVFDYAVHLFRTRGD